MWLQKAWHIAGSPGLNISLLTRMYGWKRMSNLTIRVKNFAQSKSISSGGPQTLLSWWPANSCNVVRCYRCSRPATITFVVIVACRLPLKLFKCSLNCYSGWDPNICKVLGSPACHFGRISDSSHFQTHPYSLLYGELRHVAREKELCVEWL